MPEYLIGTVVCVCEWCYSLVCVASCKYGLWELRVAIGMKL